MKKLIILFLVISAPLNLRAQSLKYNPSLIIIPHFSVMPIVFDGFSTGVSIEGIAFHPDIAFPVINFDYGNMVYRNNQVYYRLNLFYNSIGANYYYFKDRLSDRTRLMFHVGASVGVALYQERYRDPTMNINRDEMGNVIPIKAEAGFAICFDNVLVRETVGFQYMQIDNNYAKYSFGFFFMEYTSVGVMF